MNLYLLNTETTVQKLHTEQDNNTLRMALTAAVDNTNAINTVDF